MLRSFSRSAIYEKLLVISMMKNSSTCCRNYILYAVGCILQSLCHVNPMHKLTACMWFSAQVVASVAPSFGTCSIGIAASKMLNVYQPWTFVFISKRLFPTCLPPTWSQGSAFLLLPQIWLSLTIVHIYKLHLHTVTYRLQGCYIVGWAEGRASGL